MIRYYWREKIQHIIFSLVLYDDEDYHKMRIFKNEKWFLFVIIEEMNEDNYFEETHSVIYYDEEKQQFICNEYDIEEYKINQDSLKKFKDYIHKKNEKEIRDR